MRSFITILFLLCTSSASFANVKNELNSIKEHDIPELRFPTGFLMKTGEVNDLRKSLNNEPNPNQKNVGSSSDLEALPEIKIRHRLAKNKQNPLEKFGSDGIPHHEELKVTEPLTHQNGLKDEHEYKTVETLPLPEITLNLNKANKKSATVVISLNIVGNCSNSSNVGAGILIGGSVSVAPAALSKTINRAGTIPLVNRNSKAHPEVSPHVSGQGTNQPKHGNGGQGAEEAGSNGGLATGQSATVVFNFVGIGVVGFILYRKISQLQAEISQLTKKQKKGENAKSVEETKDNMNENRKDGGGGGDANGGGNEEVPAEDEQDPDEETPLINRNRKVPSPERIQPTISVTNEIDENKRKSPTTEREKLPCKEDSSEKPDSLGNEEESEEKEDDTEGSEHDSKSDDEHKSDEDKSKKKKRKKKPKPHFTGRWVEL